MYSRIAELLKEKNITFAELSRMTGITENVFSNLKNRSGGKLSADNLLKVAKALEVSIEDLLEE